jgi:short-subunit dehydrogenase
MAFSAAGKRVLITGASSGVGAALARALARDGAVVGLIARRQDRLAEVLADCRKDSADSMMWVADLADDAGTLGLQAWDALGGIDVVVPLHRDVRDHAAPARPPQPRRGAPIITT